MTAVQVVSLVVVVLGGTAVVIAREPLRQTLVLSMYGLALTLLFFSFQAPDVALSEIVVGTVGLPMIVLACLRKLSEQERDTDDEPERES